eukprot:TRINITY_DN966_c0_g1_i7.p1 TRINITY_DN966_c0_g1~~TRINITY_DN966_c0_g1_i7.p1  ORF type:complete len:360 (-),score=88.87 TRINITY_DN966_c0_g1_i7:122-1201(-)
MAKEKSLCTAYVLWLIGGWCGLHHFYLERDIQAFLWSVSWGGFGFGLLRDLWRMKDYVDDVNENPQYLQIVSATMKAYEKATSYFGRTVGQMFFGSLFYCVCSYAVSDFGDRASMVAGVFGCALGVFLVGNCGHYKGPYWGALGGAVVGQIFGYFSDTSAWFTVASVSTYGFNRYHEWDKIAAKGRLARRRGKCMRLLTLYICWGLFMAVLMSALYFNASITLDDGETVMLRDKIENIWNSPELAEFKELLKQLWQEMQRDGYKATWDKFVESLDVNGEQRAYKVLGLEESATPEEIHSKCRKLKIEWHPDKNRDREEEAQAKFIEIQKACEALDTRAKKRNSRSTEEPEPKKRARTKN